MNKNFLYPALLALAACSGEQPKETGGLIYPETRKVDTVTDYFGTKIADPYRWLEDDRSAETAEWVKKENAVTNDYLSKITFRDKIKKRLGEIWNFEKQTTPFKKGSYYFFYKNDGVQNQSVLYVKEGLNGKAKVLLDPNTFSADGTISLSGISLSKDAKYLAYGLSKAGSDWNEYYVMEVATGKKLGDHIEWMKFSGVDWKGTGFYYSAYDAPTGSELSGKNEFNKLYYHKLGDDQKKDKLIYEDKQHPKWGFYASITDDERYLLLHITESTSGGALKVLHLAPGKNSPDHEPIPANDELHSIKNETPRFIDVVTDFENDYSVIDNDGDRLLVLTNKNASNYQVVSIDPKNPRPENWKIIIPETKDLLESVSVMGNKLMVRYLKDVINRLYVYTRDGKQESEIGLNGLYTVSEMTTDRDDSLAFYSVVNFTGPAAIYKYNMNSKTSSLYFKTKIDFNSDELETKQVFYPSKDGTKIPMFITMKKGTKLDGNNPCFLFGYGGFNISYTPEFRIDRSVFLENGGVYAVANLRGGGEYGEDWHKSGTLCSKQNVFDDFIAAAEYLVKEKYTSHDKLAMHGRSNGGLLAGAVLTQRPDLAKVFVPQVGVLDMLRYHKFTIGWSWATDYGTSDDKEQFNCLVKYSPLHNIKPREYPCVMILTGDHDDRVVPAHSFKFAATLQANQKGNSPVIIRIDSNAGHGSGKPTAKQIEEYGDLWSFVFYNLGMEMK
jgi:prolyl oligopeptidase